MKTQINEDQLQLPFTDFCQTKMLAELSCDLENSRHLVRLATDECEELKNKYDSKLLRQVGSYSILNLTRQIRHEEYAKARLNDALETIKAKYS